jgi:hypothetical protein
MARPAVDLRYLPPKKTEYKLEEGVKSRQWCRVLYYDKQSSTFWRVSLTHTEEGCYLTGETHLLAQALE